MSEYQMVGLARRGLATTRDKRWLNNDSPLAIMAPR